jgi:hypothetical protein
MNATAAQTTDVFDTANDAASSFEDRLRGTLPLWAQDSATMAISPTGFQSGTTYTRERLVFNVDNRVRMDVVSAESGFRYQVVLTDNDDTANFHGFIVAIKDNSTTQELAPAVYIPIRIYFGSDRRMYVKYNAGRVA